MQIEAAGIRHIHGVLPIDAPGTAVVAVHSNRKRACTMKTLLLLRHAKSSWKDPELEDHDRPLNKRGKRDAPRVGLLLQQQQNLQPDVILCSSAKRARKTAAKVAKNCGYEGIIQLDGGLYLAGPEAVLNVLRGVADSHNCVMLVGHNPGLEYLLELLTGTQTQLPTAALAQLHVAIDSWSDVSSTTRASLVDIWRPRELE